jgi:hypothetical protein
MNVPVGNTHRLEAIDETLRTPEQLAVFKSIVQSDGFDFMCGNPFEDKFNELKGYTGPTAFIWCTTDGTLHLRRVGKRGRTLREVESK